MAMILVNQNMSLPSGPLVAGLERGTRGARRERQAIPAHDKRVPES